MSASRITSFALCVLGSVSLFAADRSPAPKTPAPAADRQFPAAMHLALTDLGRFQNPVYFDLLAADGLRAVDPRAIFARIQAAAEKGDVYKALYLSRVFTTIAPDNAAGWTNRAQLANRLGFTAEAAAALANVQADRAVAVSGDALPGAMTVKPASLADFAAALALLADDVTAREGRPVIVSVKDDLSGMDVPTAAEVERAGRGPWVTPKPVQVEHVLSNLFVLADAKPMDRKSMRGGMFALGALALAGTGYANSIGAADAASSFANLYGGAMGRAFEVPSDFKGGSYVAVTYTGVAAKRTPLQPKTAGKREAIGTPVPLLWASGPSRSPVVAAVWANGNAKKSDAMRIERAGKKAEWKKHEVPALRYPRLQQLCAAADRCSAPATLLEVLLSADDIQAMAPTLGASLPDFAAYASRYARSEPLSIASAGQTFAGYDAAGVVFVTRHQPTQWLASAPAGTAAASSLTRK
jgi:hypothetical protein